jgi:ABC-type spermidine/putrescine transport system permease subunit II
MGAARIGHLALTGIYRLVLVAVVVYMLAPTVIVTVLSFSATDFIKFPPSDWGLRQYSAFFGSSDWVTPLLRSLAVAAAASVLATIAGVGAVLAMYRTRTRGRAAMQVLGIGPLLVPGVAYAIALYSLFSSLGILGGPVALALAHATYVLPFVLLIVGAAIARVPHDLELAAIGLGASRSRAWWDITLRLLRPAIGASLIFAFVSSLDEAVIASFLGYNTLPVAIFNSVRYGVDPVITAIATLLTVGVGALLCIYAALRRAEPGR